MKSRYGAAAAINSIGVHVLIDLSGWTIFPGVEVFAMKPAPLQMCADLDSVFLRFRFQTVLFFFHNTLILSWPPQLNDFWRSGSCTAIQARWAPNTTIISRQISSPRLQIMLISSHPSPVRAAHLKRLRSLYVCGLWLKGVTHMADMSRSCCCFRARTSYRTSNNPDPKCFHRTCTKQ